MTAARWAIGLIGAALLGYGAVLAFDFATSTTKPIESGVWLVGGTVVHDAIVAPVVGGLGWLITRLVAVPWRAPVAVGAAASGVLILLATPELVRRYPPPDNPGLHDADYLRALLICLAVVWVLVLIAGTARTLAARR